ncbi:hypothetical protein [Salegentibacter chungangensis]|uniref:Fibronectin type-III domain-containing protein n=1 Tax=Salegentibacter chungangensis TaxID=1335724 RepID=A0ABW3NMN0_9FLAO
MKKLALLLILAVTIIGCSLGDDDGSSNIGYELAVINDIEVPEYFEVNETYEIDVTFTLPSACHKQLTPRSLDVRKGGSGPEERSNIYIGAVTSYNTSQDVCVEEDSSVVLERTESFSLNITENEEYTFYLWVGQNTAGEPEWRTVSVPVGAPEESN